MGTRAFYCAAVVLIAACGQGSGDDGGSPVSSSGGPVGNDAPVSTSGPAPASTAPAPSAGCTKGDAICTAKDARRACVDDGNGGTKWVDETCGAGSGCFAGACTVGKCSDECTLGDTNAGKTCSPWSAKTGTSAGAVDSKKNLHDRAREYIAWTKKGAMLTGAIGSARYQDTTYSKVTSMNGIGDSAIWTGAFLGAEAMRVWSTGAADARARVRQLVDVMHLFLNVAGEPGMLARWTKESATTFPFTVGDYDCSADRVHCGIAYQGKKYDYIGHISRDQYQGVMFGLGVAYDALGSADEDKRALIRADVVTVAKELMKERSLPVNLTFNGVAMPVKNVNMHYIVISPREMKNGAIDLRVDYPQPAGQKEAEMYGFQEFYPDLGDVVKQLPGLSWLPDGAIERASSAMMLTNFFRIAIHVTDGVAASANDHSELLAYYTQHAADWLDVAKRWKDGSACGASYYANNIAMMPMYNLTRLEDDPTRKALVRDDILGKAMWPAFEHTKNVFFSFIYAGNTPTAPSGVANSAGVQLAQFPVAPRIQRPVDLRNDPRYSARESGCTDQVSHADAVDVGDRITGDFMWQRDPWGLYDPGDVNQTQPGVDYLLPYFMGLHHGFLTDDTQGMCLAWQ